MARQRAWSARRDTSCASRTDAWAPGPDLGQAQEAQDKKSDSVASGATTAQPSAPGGVPAVVAGIDVGKSWLDTHLEPGGLARRALCKWLRKHGASRAVFEPTGCYHRRLHQCLVAADVETVAVRPDCAQRFAEALGPLIKTDRVDAKVLARYGRLEGLEATAPLDPALAQLQDLVRVRRRFVDECISLGRQEQELESPAAASRLSTRTCWRLSRPMTACAGAPRCWARSPASECSPPRPCWPTCPHSAPSPAGALLGVAPCARGSGSQDGRRHVRCGRAEPRSAL